MSDYIHGQSDDREVARLEKQARFASPTLLRRFEAAPGSWVLDLATGVGAMAGQLLERYPGIHLVGIDLQKSQLRRAAANHPGPAYIQGDGTRLPFAEASFDRVHCSWMLEHVRKPLEVLLEVRRVLKPGGYCQFVEVDNATFAIHPELKDVTDTLDALNAAQIAGGGDPFVGRKLESLLTSAGFSKVIVTPSDLDADGGDLAFFEAFVEEFAEIFESLDEAMGPENTALLHRGAASLRTLPHLPNARMFYRGWCAHGVK